MPIGPVSAHLILNGLLGAVLGWASFPAILTGLLLQAMLFQYGGVTALGVNAFDMAFPAVLCFLVFRPFLAAGGTQRTVAAFACGFLSVLLAGVLTATALALSGEAFAAVAKAILLAHLPIMAIEGVLTAMVVASWPRSAPSCSARSWPQGGLHETCDVSSCALRAALPEPARPAAAHRVNVFAYVEGDTVKVECSYSKSSRVHGGDIEVSDAATGNVYLTGKNRRRGQLRLRRPAGGPAAGP